MKKALAVTQIVLLVLGILVLAVIVYLLYTTFGPGRSEIDVQKCNAAIIRRCTSAKIAVVTGVWDGKATHDDTSASLCGKTSGSEITAAECSALGIRP